MKCYRFKIICICIIAMLLSLFTLIACQDNKPEENKNEKEIDSMPQIWEEGFYYGPKQNEDNFQEDPIHMELNGKKEVTIDIDDPYWAMWGAQDLENIYVVENHPAVKSVDGVLYSKSGETLIRWPAKKLVTKPNKNIKYFAPSCYEYCMQFSSDFELPDGVTSIGDGAFLGCALTEIHIKETVLTVNSGAFDSPSLKKITVSSPKAYRTFFASDYVQKIIFNEGVKDILSRPDEIVILRDLKEVVFPSTLEHIGDVFFPVHLNVAQYILNDGLKIIDEYAFDTYADYDISLYQRNVKTIFINLNSVAVAYLSKKVPIWDKETNIN